GDNNTLLGYNTKVKSGVSNSTAIGSGASSTTSNTVVLGTDQEIVIVPGKLEVDTLGVAGNQQLCLNKQNRLAPCSSSCVTRPTFVHSSKACRSSIACSPSASPGKTAACAISASAQRTWRKSNRY
ncbi:MAG TPA: hypothetical protein VGV87_29835, partial [Blastocatellia bacterium]|nr:hypothetical protein [Blastocatellia bacterium]